MKKIILNGCSFIAGDELVWEQYLKELGKDVNDNELIWNNPTPTPYYLALQQDYRIYRKMYNQGAILSKELGTEVIDISDDGNSNDNIALTTINQVLSIPEEDRKNYHAIIGWTRKERKLMHLNDRWLNVHTSHCINTSEYWSKFKHRLIGAILEETDSDWYINYFKNVMLLESFLKSQKITFTFYRSLGTCKEFYNEDILDEFLINLTGQSNIRLNNLTPYIFDSSNWLTFMEEDKDTGMASHSWGEYISYKIDIDWQITNTNRHPNLPAIKLLVSIIKEHLLSKNIL